MIDPHLTPAEAEARLRAIAREFRQLVRIHGTSVITDALGTVSYTTYQRAIRYSKYPELASIVMAKVEEAGWLWLNDQVNRSNTDAMPDV